MPKQPEDRRVHIVPSFEDLTVFHVDDDGSHRELDGVCSVEWSCKQGEVSTVKIEFVNTTIDVFATQNACTKPPAGWACTRDANHDGPCAAIQEPTP